MGIPQRTREIVLLVDDSPETLGMLTEALESAGLTVLVARDGETALTLIGRISPDLVLLDAVMPGLDGFETCRRLKGTPEMAETPVIFMTGLSDTADVVRGLEAGGVDYVTKPIDAEALIARIAVHVANARSVAEARSALDAAGRAVMAFDEAGEVQWATPRAATLMQGAETSPALPAWLGQSRDRPVSAVRPVEIAAPGGAVMLAYLGRTANGSVLVRVSPARTGTPARLLSDRLGLTPREGEVLARLADGKSNRDIAEILGLSPRTVTKHLEQIYAKLGVENRTSAVALALRHYEA